MAFAINIDWPGVTEERYEAVRKIVKWETDQPAGALFHVATFDAEGAHVLDLWDSPEQFQAFVDSRLMPGVMQIGITSQPTVRVLPVHALFTPGFTAK
jgi:hypothetical protein